MSDDSQPPPFDLLAMAHLRHAFANHFQPVANSSEVREVVAVRPSRWSRTRLDGITPVVVRTRPMPLTLVLMQRRAIRLCRERSFAAILSFTPFPYGFLARAAARKARLPYHVGIIGEASVDGMNPWKRHLVRSVLRDAAAITVPGERHVRRLAAAGLDRRKLFVLPHGLDSRFYADDSVPKQYDAVFVGDLLSVKQPNYLIDIWAQVVRTHSQAKLAVVGDGPQRHGIERQIRAARITENVDLLGFRSDVPDLLRRSRLFLMTSRSEGMPYALIEAMACGVVPICNDVGEIGNLLQNGDNGYCLPALVDVPDYVQHIVTLLSDPKELARMRCRSRQSVAEHRFAAVTVAWGPILNRLLESRHG